MTPDPSEPVCEISIECTRIGHRQTIHLRLINENAFTGLKSEILSNDGNMIDIHLANGEIFILDAASIWYMYRLSSSRTYSHDVLRLGYHE